jgi:hypothetical protein
MDEEETNLDKLNPKKDTKTKDKKISINYRKYVSKKISFNA